MAKRKSLRTRINARAWKVRNQFGLSWAISLKYAWSYFKSDYSQYFEIEFKKKSGQVTKRQGIDLELKKQGLVFYSLSDSSYKTASPENVISLKAVNLTLNSFDNDQ